MTSVTRAALAFAAACLIGPCTAAYAQQYPSKPVRIIVPFPAGGTADLLPRFIAERLAAKWGQAFVVENRAGAAGNIGAEAVFKADADKLSAAIAEALKTPEMHKRLLELSAEPVGNTPAEMAAHMRQDAERWRNVIRTANVRAD